MSHRRRSATTWLVLLAVLVLPVVAGCSDLPSSGPVQNEPINEQVEDEAPVYFTPDGPRTSAPPVEIVRGFLVAQQATPINLTVARQFLTAESSDAWVPETGTTVYDTETRTGRGSRVRLSLTGIVQLDDRGRWLGKQGDRAYRLQLVQEGQEWRISNPPDRLMVPTSHLETRYSQRYLYFFDKSAQVLVPEPVYVPTGAQATTFLVDGLLKGPDRDLLGVVRTFFPARTRLDDISVPVGQDGTVVVPLSDEVLDVDDDRLSLVLAQVAWTLRQVPGVERMRVTVDGSPLDLPGPGTDLPVTGWSEFDPAVSWASQSLFGLRDGRVVTMVGGEERRVSGPFGSLDLEPQRIAVDLQGEQIAATTRDGSVLVAPRSRVPGTAPRRSDVNTVYSGGSDVLSPVWDLHGQLWVLDRSPTGARVSVVRAGISREVEVAGVTGQDVESLLVSRDGTRLVAQVARDRREGVVIARVQREPDGRVRQVTTAMPLRLGGTGVRRIRDVAWRSPGTLALLTAPTSVSSQVLVVKVDGSSTVSEAAADVEVFRGVADDLVTSPVVGAPLYIRTPEGRLFALAVNGRWTAAGLRTGLRSPTFVG